MKSKLGALLPMIFVFAIVLAVINAFYTQSVVSSLHNDNGRFNYARSVGQELNTLLNLLINAESDQHNYLVTGNTQYQSTLFDTDVPNIHSSLQKLQELTIKDQEEHKTTEILETAINNRILLMQQIDMVREFQGLDAVQKLYNAQGSESNLNSIKSLLTTLRQKQRSVIDRREMLVDQNYQTLSVVTLSSNIITIIVIMLFSYVVYIELNSRSKDERLKDEFINMASHELKTPVTSLKIFTHVLEKKLEEGKVGEAKRYIGKLENQMTKLTLLISDLLDLSRIQTGKMRFEKVGFNLDALIDETVEEVQGTTKYHEIFIKGGVNRMIYADRYRIYQVLVNLLTNAIKYSPKGGKIIVTSVGEGKKVKISVADEGIGIDPKFQKKIFQRLYQVTDPSEKTYPGLGVGLYVASQIVKEHKGSIWVESEKGKGSTFYFTLPAGENN